MKNFFAVLGGMGTSATESYVRLVDRYTHAHSDQEFLDYIVFNHASVPDRTAHILEPENTPDPVPFLTDDIAQATALGASFITLPCNTAHHYFAQLQAATPIQILNMPQIAVESLGHDFPAERFPRVGLLATRGTVDAGIYRDAVISARYQYVVPDGDIQDRVDSLIYHDVKETGELHDDAYLSVLRSMFDDCDAIILGCTELSVLAEAFPHPELPIIDAQLELVKKTVELGKMLR